MSFRLFLCALGVLALAPRIAAARSACLNPEYEGLGTDEYECGKPAPISDHAPVVAALAPIANGVCDYDEVAGIALARAAEKIAGRQIPAGMCLKGTSAAIERWSRKKIELNVRPPYGALQTSAEIFENDTHPAAEWFTPVAVAEKDILNGALPPGAIIVYSNPAPRVWSRAAGCGPNYPRLSCYEVARRYGHIEIVGTDRLSGYSDGRESLDWSLRSWGSFRVYLPNGRRQGVAVTRPKGACQPDTGEYL